MSWKNMMIVHGRTWDHPAAVGTNTVGSAVEKRKTKVDPVGLESMSSRDRRKRGITRTGPMKNTFLTGKKVAGVSDATS